MASVVRDPRSVNRLVCVTCAGTGLTPWDEVGGPGHCPDCCGQGEHEDDFEDDDADTDE